MTLGISLHNFPKGSPPLVTASSNLELLRASHWRWRCNISEGLAVAGPVYAATGSKRTAIFGPVSPAGNSGGVLAWLIFGQSVSPIVMAAIGGSRRYYGGAPSVCRTDAAGKRDRSHVITPAMACFAVIASIMGLGSRHFADHRYRLRETSRRMQFP